MAVLIFANADSRCDAMGHASLALRKKPEAFPPSAFFSKYDVKVNDLLAVRRSCFSLSSVFRMFFGHQAPAVRARIPAQSRLGHVQHR